MFRKVIKIESEDDLRIELPKEYMHKEIEITASEIDDADRTATEKADFEEAMKFFDSIQIDMSNFKFDRDEANER